MREQVLVTETTNGGIRLGTSLHQKCLFQPEYNTIEHIFGANYLLPMPKYGLEGGTGKKVSLAFTPAKLKKTVNEYFGIHIAFFSKIPLEKML